MWLLNVSNSYVIMSFWKQYKKLDCSYTQTKQLAQGKQIILSLETTSADCKIQEDEVGLALKNLFFLSLF